MAHPFDNFDDAHAFALDMQIDAMTRVSYLQHMKTGISPSLDSILKSLSDAEEKAQFVCGFVALYKDEDYTKKLKSYVVQEGYFSPNGNMLSKGIERGSKNQLPGPIESRI